MPLVEVVRAERTNADTFGMAMAFARSLGKEAVASSDTSGFLVNRLLVPYLLDAVRALESGTGSIADLDTAMRLG
jgi:3-hydroxybutyryl-CoA dehydrogenase